MHTPFLLLAIVSCALAATQIYGINGNNKIVSIDITSGIITVPAGAKPLTWSENFLFNDAPVVVGTTMYLYETRLANQAGGYMWLYGYDVNTGAQLSNTSVPLLSEFNPNNGQTLNGIDYYPSKNSIVAWGLSPDAERINIALVSLSDFSTSNFSVALSDDYNFNPWIYGVHSMDDKDGLLLIPLMLSNASSNFDGWIAINLGEESVAWTAIYSYSNSIAYDQWGYVTSSSSYPILGMGEYEGVQAGVISYNPSNGNPHLVSQAKLTNCSPCVNDDVNFYCMCNNFFSVFVISSGHISSSTNCLHTGCGGAHYWAVAH